jgi:hypothetical protein
LHLQRACLLDYQIKDGGLLGNWLFFLVSYSLSEWDASSEIIGGNEVKATMSASFLLVDCPNIYLQAEAVYQTSRKELVLTLREAVKNENKHRPSTMRRVRRRADGPRNQSLRTQKSSIDFPANDTALPITQLYGLHKPAKPPSFQQAQALEVRRRAVPIPTKKTKHPKFLLAPTTVYSGPVFQVQISLIEGEDPEICGLATHAL